MTDDDNTIILETTKGTVVIQMRPDLAPGHVARIKELVRDHFYDGIVFHRVIEGFMAQTGCPQRTRTKNTGIDWKLSRSATMPVGMSPPVSGHLIITTPILASRPVLIVR